MDFFVTRNQRLAFKVSKYDNSSSAQHVTSILTKWSDKVNTVSNLSNSKKFQAVNQNAATQIELAMMGSEREKLIRRSQIRRNGDVKEFDDQVYDDLDFYESLLKDIVQGLIFVLMIR